MAETYNPPCNMVEDLLYREREKYAAALVLAACYSAYRAHRQGGRAKPSTDGVSIDALVRAKPIRDFVQNGQGYVPSAKGVPFYFKIDSKRPGNLRRAHWRKYHQARAPNPIRESKSEKGRRERRTSSVIALVQSSRVH